MSRVLENDLNTYGFFGKLPLMGDFVSRGWLVGVRDGLDKLLQEAILSILASSLDGKALLRQTACLVLSIRPGVLCEHGVITIVLPSEDRVGRVFPLCVGVQWLAEGISGKGWPSIAYAKALMLRVKQCIELETDLDGLLSEIESVGPPQQFAATFPGRSGDETMPRIGASTTLLHVRGAVDQMSPALFALCSMLNESSDLLGMRLDEAAEVQDLFACRKVESGTALASAFDGLWDQRGWTSYDSPRQSEPKAVDAPETVDDDATRPFRRPTPPSEA